MSTGPPLSGNPRPKRQNSSTPSPSTSVFVDPNNTSFFSDTASTAAAVSPIEETPPPSPLPMPTTQNRRPQRKSSLHEVYCRPRLSNVESVSCRSRSSTISSALSSELTMDDDGTEEDRKYLASAGRDSNIPPPPPPAKDDGYVSRPPTGASTRKHERISIRKPVLKFIKIGGLNVELSPQPSDDPEDPLNWSLWKKNLSFYSILIFTCLTSASKTALLSSSALAAEAFSVPHASIAGLTAMPLILAALSGMISISISRVTGKRPLYLVSAGLVVLGTLLTMCANNNSLGALTAGRFFSGWGTGAFDVLFLGTIHDLFFEHERGVRLALYAGATTASLWLSPVIGGAGVNNTGRFTLPFEVISGLFLVAIPLLICGAYETAYSRAWSAEPCVMTVIPEQPVPSTLGECLAQFIQNPPSTMPYYGTGPTWSSTLALVRAPRAAIAPTTALVAAVYLLPAGALWGFSSSMSLLFSAKLSPNSIGALFVGAFLLGVPIVVAPCFYRPLQRGAIVLIAGLTSIGAGMAFIALLALGLTIANALPGNTKLAENATRLEGISDANFAGIAVLIALLAAGVYAMQAAQLAMVSASAQSASASLYEGLANAVDMAAGVKVWENLFGGIMAVGIPTALQTHAAAGVVQSQGVALGVVQLFVAGGIVALWWLRGEDVRRWDGRVMGLVNISELARSGSFFGKE